MRHLKRRSKLGKDSAHRRCMIANMLKSLIENERIETSIVKAKEVKRHADKLITLAKNKDNLSGIRLAKSKLMIRYNTLSSKEKRDIKKSPENSSNLKDKYYNTDRKVITKLFSILKTRFEARNGGYTRIILKDESRKGDGSRKCYLEYLQ